MLPRLTEKCLVADAESLAMCKFSVCCTPKMTFWHGKKQPVSLCLCNRAGVHAVPTSFQGASPLQPQWHTFLKWLCCDTQHHRMQAEFEWGAGQLAWEHLHGWGVASVLPAGRCRCEFTLTTKPRAGSCPFSRMWVGRQPLDAPGIPHCLWSRSLWITDRGTNAPHFASPVHFPLLSQQ